MNLFEAVAEHARSDRPALCTGPRVLDYGGLLSLVEQTSRALVAAGVEPGARLVVLLPNSVEHVVAILAAGVVGAIAVPCDPRAGRVRLARVIAETSPHLCLLPPGAEPQTDSDTLQFEIDLAARTACFTPASVGRAERSARRTVETCEAVIRFTSGSTGRPKGVVLEHEQLVATARMVSQLFGLEGDHRELVVTPISHSGGWQRVAATLVGGGCVVLPEEPFSLPVMLDDIDVLDVHGFFAPPPVIRLLLAAGPRAADALADCRSIEVGSAALSASELAGLLQLVPAARVFVHYGLTECSRALVLDARAHPAKLDTVGRPAPGVDVEVRDEEGRRLTADSTGQVFLRGPQLGRRYFGRPDLDAERFVEGWLATGDYGRLDSQGFLEFLGRRDDRIESAGYSFFPAEVEAELGPVDGVEQYFIAGVPDPREILGEIPWAFVVPSEPEHFSPRSFAQQAQRKLPGYMVPRKVVALPELPLTASGKPDRRSAVETHALAGDG